MKTTNNAIAFIYCKLGQKMTNLLTCKQQDILTIHRGSHEPESLTW